MTPRHLPTLITRDDAIDALEALRRDPLNAKAAARADAVIAARDGEPSEIRMTTYRASRPPSDAPYRQLQVAAGEIDLVAWLLYQTRPVGEVGDKIVLSVAVDHRDEPVYSLTVCAHRRWSLWAPNGRSDVVCTECSARGQTTRPRDEDDALETVRDARESAAWEAA